MLPVLKAGEALAAIGHPSIETVLREHVSDHAVEVIELRCVYVCVFV